MHWGYMRESNAKNNSGSLVSQEKTSLNLFSLLISRIESLQPTTPKA